MKPCHRPCARGFTLIEILAVITIIVILAAIGISGMGWVTERQNRDKAATQVKLLESALEAYEADMAGYPTGNGDTNSSQALYNALFYDGYDYLNQATPPSTWTKASRIYCEPLDPRTRGQGWVDFETSETPKKDQLIRDPWGRGYRYRIGSSAQNPDFDLWSAGKDGKTSLTSPALTVADNKDDIRNF
jgi:prepilin-type N-terminal cleavage/methylation domain-containing protein